VNQKKHWFTYSLFSVFINDRYVANESYLDKKKKKTLNNECAMIEEKTLKGRIIFISQNYYN